ncbi:MAG: K(+)-transporting ATPase subunit F [Bacteroidota bacterium]
MSCSSISCWTGMGKEGTDGFPLRGCDRGMLCGIVRFAPGVRMALGRKYGKTSMNGLYFVSMIIAAALAIYLFVALLRPEKLE